MILRVSIEHSQSLISRGKAIVMYQGKERCISFDVLTGAPELEVVVGGHGPLLSVNEARTFATALKSLLVEHSVPLQTMHKIKKISIQLNHDLICGGMAYVERDGHAECIYFDVVKGGPTPKVIVGGRGKKVLDKDADMYEKALLALFLLYGVPLEIGNYSITA